MQENTRWYSLAVIAHACRLGPQVENSRAKHSTENYYPLSIKYFTGKRLLTKRYFSWRVFFFLEPIFLLLFWTFQIRKIKRTGHHLSEGGEGEKSLENINCVTIELTWSPPSPPPRLCMTPLPFIGSKLTDTPSALPKTHVISPKILHTPSPLSKGTKKDWYLEALDTYRYTFATSPQPFA